MCRSDDLAVLFQLDPYYTYTECFNWISSLQSGNIVQSRNIQLDIFISIRPLHFQYRVFQLGRSLQNRIYLSIPIWITIWLLGNMGRLELEPVWSRGYHTRREHRSSRVRFPAESELLQMCLEYRMLPCEDNWEILTELFVVISRNFVNRLLASHQSKLFMILFYSIISLPC